MQTVVKRKLSLFGHTYRLEDSRKIKCVMLGIMDGKGQCGRSNREWIGDIKEWRKQDLPSLAIIVVSARNRGLWKVTMQLALGT